MITFNGLQPKSLYFGDTPVVALYYNGLKVWGSNHNEIAGEIFVEVKTDTSGNIISVSAFPLIASGEFSMDASVSEHNSKSHRSSISDDFKIEFSGIRLISSQLTRIFDSISTDELANHRVSKSAVVKYDPYEYTLAIANDRIATSVTSEWAVDAQADVVQANSIVSDTTPSSSNTDSSTPDFGIARVGSATQQCKTVYAGVSGDGICRVWTAQYICRSTQPVIFDEPVVSNIGVGAEMKCESIDDQKNIVNPRISLGGIPATTSTNVATKPAVSESTNSKTLCGRSAGKCGTSSIAKMEVTSAEPWVIQTGSTLMIKRIYSAEQVGSTLKIM